MVVLRRLLATILGIPTIAKRQENTVMKNATNIALLLACISIGTAAWADPAGRVGRISYTQGPVTFRDTSSGEPVAASLNWPVTSHNIIATDNGGRAEIRVGSAAVRVAADSELEIDALDDTHFQLYLNRGSAEVHIRNRDMAKSFELATPQGRVRLNEAGSARIDVQTVAATTAVSVLAGTAQIENAGSVLTLRPGQRMQTGTGDMHVSAFPPGRIADDFDAWVQARDRRDEQSASVRYISPETTGYEELDSNGRWRVTPGYGALWYPTVVPADWAPYRAGRWTWVEPWGWTWVDNASWGYAPSHYGRWLWLDGRWCWSPGTIVPRPVWAPALVGWVGGSTGASFVIGTAPAVGWFPLAPHEIYVPSYRVSAGYLRQVNITHVTNITNVINVHGFASVPPQNTYQNRFAPNAVTVMAHDRFQGNGTVLVTPVAPHGDMSRILRTAAISAVVPAAIIAAHVSRRYGPENQARGHTPVNNPARQPVPSSFASQGQTRQRAVPQNIPAQQGLFQAQAPHPVNPSYAAPATSPHRTEWQNRSTETHVRPHHTSQEAFNTANPAAPRTFVPHVQQQSVQTVQQAPQAQHRPAANFIPPVSTPAPPRHSMEQHVAPVHVEVHTENHRHAELPPVLAERRAETHAHQTSGEQHSHGHGQKQEKPFER
jgi:FecR protein